MLPLGQLARMYMCLRIVILLVIAFFLPHWREKDWI